jgi:hypothetical protein
MEAHPGDASFPPRLLEDALHEVRGVDDRSGLGREHEPLDVVDKQSDVELTPDDGLEGRPRFFCTDPFGNSVEIVSTTRA